MKSSMTIHVRLHRLKRGRISANITDNGYGTNLLSRRNLRRRDSAIDRVRRILNDEFAGWVPSISVQFDGPVMAEPAPAGTPRLSRSTA